MTNKSNKEKVLEALKEKKLIKVISGINNYDKQKVIDVVTAAEFGGATAVDICDSEDIITAVRATIELPIFVSSIDPEKLINAQALGANVLEIGNFENLNRKYSALEVLNIAKAVKASIKEDDVLLCCTVPGDLPVEEQVKLAKDLVNIGVDMIQSEGFSDDLSSSMCENPNYIQVLKAASTLTNTREISKAVPYAKIITASGITPFTAPFAVSAGACGVGVGTFISREPYQAYMTEKVKELVAGMYQFEIVKSDSKKVLTFNIN